MTAAVAPEVIQSLDDANSRVIAAIAPTARKSIEANMTKLHAALMDRDIVRGRDAFYAAIAAITAAERSDAESRPELGALRLGLVPAARSLGLPVSDTDAPAN